MASSCPRLRRLVLNDMPQLDDRYHIDGAVTYTHSHTGIPSTPRTDSSVLYVWCQRPGGGRWGGPLCARVPRGVGV